MISCDVLDGNSMAFQAVCRDGNANGDISILEFTADSKSPSSCALVNHDDSEHEFASTPGAGKLHETAKVEVRESA